MIASHSKKKIFLQYDQYADQTITKAQFQKFQEQVEQDPVARILLGLKPESEQSYIISSGTDSVNTSFSSEQSIKQKDFDHIIQQMNSELQNLFIINQLERYPEPTLQKGNVTLTSYVELIDCIKMESYNAPQLNLVPLKLMMLKKKPDIALKLCLQGLHMIANFFPRHVNSSSKQTYLREHLYHDKSVQFGQDTFVKSEFEVFKELVIFAVNRQIDKLKEALKKDQIFIDDIQKWTSIYKMMRQSLRFTISFNDFVTDLHQRILDMVNEAIVSGKEFAQKDINSLIIQQQEDKQPALLKPPSAHKKTPIKSPAKSSDSEKNHKIKAPVVKVTKGTKQAQIQKFSSGNTSTKVRNSPRSLSCLTLKREDDLVFESNQQAKNPAALQGLDALAARKVARREMKQELLEYKESLVSTGVQTES